MVDEPASSIISASLKVEVGGSTLVIYNRLHEITFQNTINLHHNCCEILKSSKTVPTVLEIVLFSRNVTASNVAERTIRVHVNVAMVWSDPFIR